VKRDSGSCRWVEANQSTSPLSTSAPNGRTGRRTQRPLRLTPQRAVPIRFIPRLWPAARSTRYPTASRSRVAPRGGQTAPLAFNCNCGAGTQIMLLTSPLAGAGTLRPLINALPRNIFPSFSKDGSRIVFATNRDGNYEIYEIYN
jgi:WD40-like Beta Propeller Repeat